MRRTLHWHVLWSEGAIIAYLVAAKILFHLLHPEYGYFRDELYYMTVSDRFSFSNLDILPLMPLYLKLVTTLVGSSIKAIHFASALCGAGFLILACQITRELGGRKFAILMAGLCVLFSGSLVFGALFSYDSLDFVLQAAAIYVLVRIVKGGDARLWILFGLILGLGLLNKLSILLLGAAVFVSLWLVPQRAHFRTKWIWIAGLIALTFSIPFILWQSQHNWYFLGFAASYAGGVAYAPSFLEFLWSQILPNNVAGFPIWVLGLGMLLFALRWKQYRLFGLMYVVDFLLAFFIGVKFYFLIPIYVILFAVGSTEIEAYLDRRAARRQGRSLIRIALPFVFVILSLPLIPMLVPILPVEKLVKFASALGVDAGVRHENLQEKQLPQHFADRFGWEEMVDQVAEVYDSVATRGDADVGILTNNYGQAGAIHVLGKKRHLPDAICAEGWFYFETLREQAFDKEYVTIGVSRDYLSQLFREVIPCGVYTNRYCMPYENNKPLFLCRQAKYDLADFWRIAKRPDPEFLAVLQDSGVGAAIDYYHRMKQKNPSLLLFTEYHMNSLGYQYLYAGNVKEAIALFRLNVEVYPDAWNVYDSLGEALAKDGQVELALANYRKSLELNPNNANGKEKLKELEEGRGEAR